MDRLDQWFADRDLDLVISDDEGISWATLVSKRSGQVFALRYGRGDSVLEAAESARQRYIEEEGTRIADDDVPAIRRLFKEQGYAGQLLVLDDDQDEAVFLVPSEAYLAIDHAALCTSLQSLLHRKVWVTTLTPELTSRARLFK